jgi:hypothetical protein
VLLLSYVILLRKPDGKETAMDEREALRLAQDIRRQAPHLLVKVNTVEAIGWKAWAVYIYARGSNKLLLVIENPSDWEEQKAPFLL